MTPREPTTAAEKVSARGSALVVRTNVPLGLKYGEYKPFLRHDFFCSCAYCTMTESEATAIRFTIDHYEPRVARPDLEHEYSNLMYACDECNLRKGNRTPPVEARTAGFRFFRPDEDARQDHFEKNGLRLNAKSNVGTFTIAALDLNRLSLRRLRDIRDRVTKCDQFAADGVMALRGFRIDRLPPHVKAKAALAIKRAVALAQEAGEDIDALLRDYARSPLDAKDGESAQIAAERRAKLKHLEGLYPGAWRAHRRGAKGSRRGR